MVKPAFSKALTTARPSTPEASGSSCGGVYIYRPHDRGVSHRDRFPPFTAALQDKLDGVPGHGKSLFLILRERDVHAVASARDEGGTGLYL